MGRFFLEKILPYVIAPIYWLYSCTWRLRESGPPDVLARYVQTKKPEPCLYAHWHGDELVLIGYYSYRSLAVLSSLSKDGSIMAKTLELLGYQVFRGSSSRGGARGLIGLIRAVKEGSQSALAVDGPKGPIYVVKPGIVELARRTGKPIVPVRARASRAYFIPRAWNKCYLPNFFTRVDVAYGESLTVPADLPDDKIEEVCAAVKAQLEKIILP